MSVSYSTNWMGPVSMDWYKERGLLEEGSVEPTTWYSAGRIDIYGLDENEYYNGQYEYGLRPMHSEDWNTLSEWLDDIETEECLSYDKLIETFEKHYGREIRWMK